MAKTKNKKKNLAEHISDKKKGKHVKTLNPFEVHINKEKMKILGRKLKHDRGLPGVSRAKAIQKRKVTLLQEFKLMNKSNKFIDKRIGERNVGFTQDDRAMARYAAVRVKAHKKASIFNLASEEVLTHRGQTLNVIEKFDDPKSDDDDEESLDEQSGKLESDFVGDAHFGGGILTKTGNEGFKSHKDLIDQLINESKKRKAEKQRAKEHTLELTEKLDAEWKDLIPLVNKSFKQPEERRLEKKPDVDDYDKIMKELRNEPRGQPSDRLKTEDEIAKQEREKLEKLEKERLSRMKGIFAEDNSKTVQHRSADDLDDDFVFDPEPDITLSYNEKGESNIPIEMEEQHEESASESEEESSEDETASEDDLSDLKEDSVSEEEEDEVSANDLKNEDEPRLELNTKKEKKKKVSANDLKSEDDPCLELNTKKENIKADLFQRKEMMEKAREELPYTFNLPDSYQDLRKVLKDQSVEHHCVILERMIKCNHPSLGEANKEKLGLLFVYLLQYIDDFDVDNICECFKIFSALVPHFFDLAQLNSDNAQHSIAEVIKEKQQNYRKTKKIYPNVTILFYLKLVSCLFPTSDFRHPVVTPSIVFIDQMLQRCKVRTRKDIAYGLFLVSLILEFTVLSKRYLPAAINFLGGVLHMAIPKTSVRLIKVIPPFRSVSNLLVLYNKHCPVIDTLKLEPIDLTESEISDDFKTRCIYVSLKIVKEFNENLKELSSNRDIFCSIQKYLQHLPLTYYAAEVQSEIRNVLSLLESNSDRKLFYIVMEASKPKALRLYEPNIQKVYDVKNRRVMTKEKTERAKLLHKIKNERKGALREIRRDRSFLATVKINDRIKSDTQRREKVKRIFSEANIQQSELNAMDRKNKRR